MSLSQEAAGDKYTHAVQWSLHVVTMQWLHDSVRNKGAVEEKDYRVDGAPGLCC